MLRAVVILRIRAADAERADYLARYQTDRYGSFLGVRAVFAADAREAFATALGMLQIEHDHATFGKDRSTV